MNNSENSSTIFVSSTFIDLKEYREVVTSAIRGLKNHTNDMVDWPADERDARTLSLDELRQSDVVILILAHRYGTVPRGETRSITEIEFDTAMTEKKPILAFFVDKDYGWPESKIDFEQRGKLVAFKKKVADHCTPATFTTPDNLARKVTSALAGFDRGRGKGLDKSQITTTAWVNQTSALNDTADSIVPIGIAEDGLPMTLQIVRSDNLALPISEITRVFANPEKKSATKRLNSYIEGVVKGAEQEWKRRGVYHIDLPSGETERCYVSKKRMLDLFSNSLLSILLPSPMIGGDPMTVGLLSQGALGSPSSVSHNRFLAIGLNGDQKFVVELEQKEKKQFSFVRQFAHESLAMVTECEFETQAESKVLSSGPLGEYVQKLMRDFELLANSNGKAYVQVTFRIGRRSIAGVILDIIRKVDEYHKRRVVHGDIKPQNCLITTTGACLIDSLELPVGAISNAITSIWAAPEQISLSPITEQTDIFPIGLMLVSLLSGQLVGEIVRYQVPLEDGHSRIISILRNPRVFLKRDDTRMPLEGEGAWIAFIEKCLRFDPTERHASANVSASELKQLITKFPPAGWLTFRLDRGELQMVRLPNGTETLARVLRDSSYGVVTLLKCPSCDSPNRSEARFCQVCGTRITSWIR